jgi:hypothetical protein
MDGKLWTPEEIQGSVTAVSDDYCFMTGSPLGPIDFYYRSQIDGEELDTIQVCAEPTIGYDINLFNENAVEVLSRVDFSYWSLIAMPRDTLSEEALNQL